MSIRSRIIVLVVLLLAVLATGMLLLTYPRMATLIKTDLARRAEEQLQRIEELVELTLRSGESAAAALAALPEARAVARSRMTDAAALVEKTTSDTALSRRLAEAAALVPDTEEAFCQFADGSVLTAPGIPAPSRDAAWYSDMAYASRTLPVTDLHISATGKSLAGTVAARIRSEGGDVLGLAVLERNLAPLMDALRDIRLGKGGYVALFDTSGRVLLDPATQENLLRHPADIPDEALLRIARMPEGRTEVTRRGIAYTVFIRPLPGPQWKAALFMERAGQTAAIDSAFRPLALGVVIILAVFAVAGILAACRITRPLEAVIKQSRSLAEGNTAALAAIPGRGTDIAILHANLGILSGRVMLLTKAERDKARAAEDHGKQAASDRARADAADKALKTARAEILLAGTARKSARKALALAESMGAAATLATVEQGRASETAVQLEADLLVGGEWAARLTGSIAAIASQMDELAAGLPLLSRSVQAGASLAREAGRAAGEAADLAVRLPESLAAVKSLVRDMGGTATALRELAGALNMAGLTASIEAAGAGKGGAALTAVAGETRTMAEQAMGLAARLDAALAPLEQTHAGHAMTTAKGAAAAQRTAELAQKAIRTAELAESGMAILSGQIQNLEAACNAALTASSSDGENRIARAIAAARKTLTHLRDLGAPLHRAATLAERLHAAAVSSALTTNAPSAHNEKALD